MYLRASEEDSPETDLEAIFSQSPSLPVIVLSDKSSEDFILNAWRSGATDIIFSPITTQVLDGSLQQVARRLFAPDSESLEQTVASFVFRNEFGEECREDVKTQKFTIGRSSSNDLVIGERGVSRFHAEVLNNDGEYLLRDLDSKMGTYVNGIKVDQAQLKNGDRIQLGSLQSPGLSFQTGDLLQSLLSRSDPSVEVGLSLYNFKEFGKLFTTLRALSSVPFLDDLLALVLDTAIDLTGAERGFVMLKEQGDELGFRCARNNKKQSLEGSLFQTSQRVPRDVFKSGKPVVITDLEFEEQEQSHEFTRQLGLRSVCCVPLRYLTMHESGGHSTIARAETIGVLYVDSSNTAACVSKSRIDALETLASEAAMAIYNARLYKVSQDMRRMDEQLAVAREIQQALLPQPERVLPYACASSHNIPCYQIGGDFFDYFDLSDGRFGFAIGDVAGKGVPAAILASMVQGAFSSQSFSNAPLTEIIGKVNRKLSQRGPGNRFVTFFFGILDREGNCIYVNAGHNPPLLLSQDGSLKELTVGGMVLGLFPEAQYESGTIRLNPGEHLVLFTDGVVEALNPSGEEFGIERLSELLQSSTQLPASEILVRIREAVLSFSTHAPQHDDITMMVLDFAGPTEH